MENSEITRGSDNNDEYFVTALKIFEYCGADNNQNLRVDTLMEKLAPFIKTNKTEYCYLRSLLDPEKINPEIDVGKLAETLHTYSESQKTKERDESFNMKNGLMPQDSDSGISTDGFQMLEDLQCELREKSHLANKLRNQLDFTDHQYEEMVASLTTERNSLRKHNNMLKEENQSLIHLKRDYDDVCERLCSSEAALDDARKELDMIRKQTRAQQDEIESSHSEILILQELLAKSKAECHKINEMYASRQAALIEQNETLKTDFADVSSRLQDQEEFMQQIIKEKVLIEMELKDLVNKSNQSNSKMDRSIDVSYTEDQMISTLEGISPETKFNQEHELDEDVFMNTLRDETCRSANMSLFDEIRLSFGSFKKKENETYPKCMTENKFSVTTQTEISYFNDMNDDIYDNDLFNKSDICVKCENSVKYTNKIENDLTIAKFAISSMKLELDKYEACLDELQKCVGQADHENKILELVVDALKAKMAILESACNNQSQILGALTVSRVIIESQTESVHISVSTQTEDGNHQPCVLSRGRPRRWREFFWDSLKSLFQVFAVLCFCASIIFLYGATRARGGHCAGVPARWLAARELLDAVLRVQYVGEVPM